MGSLPSYKASLCLCNPCYAAGFPGISSMRLPEYLICNCRNTLVSKTIYTKIKSQKKSKLQLFLLGALQDVQLNWFRRGCMYWFEFFPKKNSTSEHSKVEHKSRVWLRRLQTAESELPAMTFAGELLQQPPPSSKVANLPQAASLFLALRANDSSGSSPSLPAASRGGKTSPRRRFPKSAARGTSAEHRCRWEVGGLLLGANPKPRGRGWGDRTPTPGSEPCRGLGEFGGLQPVERGGLLR